MDLHIKKIVGYAFDKNIITLYDAINVQMPNKGFIFHFKDIIYLIICLKMKSFNLLVKRNVLMIISI